MNGYFLQNQINLWYLVSYQFTCSIRGDCAKFANRSDDSTDAHDADIAGNRGQGVSLAK
jgi:hypothetical protein